jgi:hypothetical protein
VVFEPDMGQGTPGGRFVAHLGGTLARFLPGGVDLLPPVASPGAAADAPPPIAQARSKRRPREPGVRFALA